jgi:hypothetical protein
MRGFFQSKLYEAVEDMAKALAAYAVVIYGMTLAGRWWSDVMVGLRWIVSMFGQAATPVVGLRQVVATLGAIGVIGMAITRQVRDGRRGVM